MASFKLAIAGLGTVGAGVLKLLETHRDRLERRIGRPLEVIAVSAQDRTRDRGVDLSRVAWFDDAVAMASDSDADAVVELIGGSDGVAHALSAAALERGRHVVTANKALIAHHGPDLAARAETSGAALCFEAAVAGGIPVIKSIRDGLIGNRIDRIAGILNGTCNYILTEMRETGAAFDAVLAEAQTLGYAEADPGFDIDGVDTAHKLVILANLAFGARIPFEAVHVEGIRGIAAEDIRYAEELGFRIKLLGLAQCDAETVSVRVHSALVPLDAPVAHVEDVFNAVVTEGDFVGRSVLEGRGAGAGPTASAVVADIADLAAGRRGPAFGVPAHTLSERTVASMESHRGACYLRLTVLDDVGVFADIARILKEEGVSMETLSQRSRDPGQKVPVVMTLHETEERAVHRALKKIGELPTVVEDPHMIRIERFDAA